MKDHNDFNFYYWFFFFFNLKKKEFSWILSVKQGVCTISEKLEFIYINFLIYTNRLPFVPDTYFISENDIIKDGNNVTLTEILIFYWLWKL